MKLTSRPETKSKDFWGGSELNIPYGWSLKTTIRTPEEHYTITDYCDTRDAKGEQNADGTFTIVSFVDCVSLI